MRAGKEIKNNSIFKNANKTEVSQFSYFVYFSKNQNDYALCRFFSFSSSVALYLTTFV